VILKGLEVWKRNFGVRERGKQKWKEAWISFKFLFDSLLFQGKNNLYCVWFW
jgi:hypothetical protein